MLLLVLLVLILVHSFLSKLLTVPSYVNKLLITSFSGSFRSVSLMYIVRKVTINNSITFIDIVPMSASVVIVSVATSSAKEVGSSRISTTMF